MEGLPSDCLDHVLNFVGDGSYRYVAMVSGSFRRRYECLFPERKTHVSLGVSSLAHAQVLLNEYNGNQTIPYSYASSQGRLDVLQLLHDSEWDWNFFNCYHRAACHEHYDVLQWLCRNAGFGIPLMAWVPAIRRGQLDLLKWYRSVLDRRSWETGVEPFVAHLSADSGQLNVLQWAHSEGYQVNYVECLRKAAVNNHLEVVEWLEATMPMNKAELCLEAVRAGNLSALQWAYSREYPLDHQICLQAAASNGHTHVVDWLNRTHRPSD